MCHAKLTLRMICHVFIMLHSKTQLLIKFSCKTEDKIIADL